MLLDLAHSLRSRPEVVSVERRSDIEGSADQPSVEWHVDAELKGGHALSFRLLVFWVEDEWIVESDVRRVHAGGSDAEVELATRYALDDDLEKELISAASQLAASLNVVLPQ